MSLKQVEMARVRARSEGRKQPTLKAGQRPAPRVRLR